jgi:peptidoglycan/LPS O-acetylase OafA/YrhL
VTVHRRTLVGVGALVLVAAWAAGWGCSPAADATGVNFLTANRAPPLLVANGVPINVIGKDNFTAHDRDPDADIPRCGLDNL